MNARLRFAVLSPIILVVLLASAVFPLTARADEATPPPPEASEATGADPAAPAEATDGSAEAPAASDALDVTAATEAPPEVATEGAPTEAAPPIDATEEVPLDSVTAGVAAEDPAPTDIATALPEGTDLVVLDATGAAEPLATVEAAEIIASGDPIWCPGVPGDGGCSDSYSDLASLLTDLTANQPDQDGTIWIEAGNDTSGPFVLNGGTLSTWSQHSLNIQGGWDLSDAGNVSGTTTFDGSLSIVNWNADISINDVIFDLIPENQPATGLEVSTTGSIDLDNVVSSGNAFAGADLEGDKRVAVRNSTFNDNGWVGLHAKSLGDIVVEDTEASGNGEDADPESDYGMGAWLDNQWDEANGAISVTGGVFNDNYNQGLVAFSLGDISVLGADASGNGSSYFMGDFYDLGAGMALDNCAPDWWDGTCQGTGDIYVQGGTFEHNAAAGLGAISGGNIAVRDIVAQDNGGEAFDFDIFGTGLGAILYNMEAGPEAGVDISGSSFNANFSDGLVVLSLGNVTVTNSQALANGAFSSRFDEFGPLLQIEAISMADGMHITAGGDISLANVSLNDNTGMGALLYNCLPDGGDACMDEADITLSNVTALRNGMDGVTVLTAGNVAVVNSRADENGSGSGPIGPIFNVGLPGIVEPGFFGDGFNIAALGDITFENVSMSYNSGFGGELNSFLRFPDEGPFPFPFFGEGDVSLINVTADGNGMGGAIVFSTGSVLVDPSSFSANGSGGMFDGLGDDGFYEIFGGHGLVVIGVGGVNVYDSTFSGNAGSGLILISDADSLVQCSTFEDNGAPEAEFPSGFGLVASPMETDITVTLAGDTFGGNALADYLDLTYEDRVVVVQTECGSSEKVRRPGETSGPLWNIVNVTQTEPVGLDCAAYIGTVLVLPNGDHAMLPCPIQDQATLGGHTTETLPGPLEGGLTFLSGMEVGLTQNGQTVDPLNATLQVHFVIPEGQQGSQLSILHWNGSEWEHLDGVVSADGQLQASHDGTGVFVLVSG